MKTPEQTSWRTAVHGRDAHGTFQFAAALTDKRFGFKPIEAKLAHMLLARRTSTTGVVYYASPLLEHYQIPHAFSTRLGGISPPPFDSMNLGNPNGCAIQDDTDRIAQNYRCLMTAIGCEKLPRYYLHQIHSAEVSVVDHRDFSNSTKGDALVTTMPGIVLSVRVADCCPVLVATTDGRAVAAIHAGWRGAVGGAVNAAVAKLQQIAGIEPSKLIAAIGPCIGFDAFEVGPEVLTEFEAVFGTKAPIHRNVGWASPTMPALVGKAHPTPDDVGTASSGKGRVDLVSACRLQLLRAGLQKENIDLTDRCTFEHADEFFSHRRDKGVTGRMAALIATKQNI